MIYIAYFLDIYMVYDTQKLILTCILFLRQDCPPNFAYSNWLKSLNWSSRWLCDCTAVNVTNNVSLMYSAVKSIESV